MWGGSAVPLCRRHEAAFVPWISSSPHLLVLGGTCSASFKRVIVPLLRGRQGWDAQARHFEHEGPRPPALSLCLHLLPRWLRAAPTVDAASERRLLRDRPPLAPLCVSLRCLAACVLLGHALDKKEGLRAQHSHFRRHVRNVTLARNALQRSHASGVPWARGGCRFRRAQRHRPLGAADRRAPAVHANALALLTQRVSAPRRQRRAFACARWLL